LNSKGKIQGAEMGAEFCDSGESNWIQQNTINWFIEEVNMAETSHRQGLPTVPTASLQWSLQKWGLFLWPWRGLFIPISSDSELPHNIRPMK